MKCLCVLLGLVFLGFKSQAQIISTPTLLLPVPDYSSPVTRRHQSLFFGSSVGNGGKYVKCPNRNGEYGYYFFDYFFLSSNSENNIWKKFNGLTLDQVLQQIIYNFGVIDSYTAIRLSQKIYEIQNHRVRLYDQDDFDSASLIFFVTKDDKSYRNSYSKILRGCTIHQLITQQAHQYVSHRYFFNETIFAKLDIKNQAFAILHEAIYGVLIDDGQAGDSLPVIQMLQFLVTLPYYEMATEQTTQSLKQEYQNLSQQIGLKLIQ